VVQEFSSNLPQIARDESYLHQDSPFRASTTRRIINSKFLVAERRCPRATSLDNLPRINQRRQVEADDVHLQFDSVGVLNHGAYDSILDFAAVQVHADCVADLKFALWFLGWQGRNLPTIIEIWFLIVTQNERRAAI
jgi:hypothetical protein